MRTWIRLSSMVILSPALIVGCAQKSSTTRVSSYRTSYPAYASTTTYEAGQPVYSENSSSTESPTYTTSETPVYTKEKTYEKPSRHARSRKVERARTYEPADSSSSRQSILTGSHDEPARESPYSIGFDELRSHIKDRSAIIVDARTSDQFALGHVRGAVNIPAGIKENLRDRYLSNASPDQLIIVYCSSSSCNSSDMVAEQLMAQGFTNVRVFTPGWQVLSRQRDLR